MEYMILTESELLDVLDVCSDLEAYYSHEADGVHIYGSADTLDDIESVLWASEFIYNCQLKALTMAENRQKEGIFVCVDILPHQH